MTTRRPFAIDVAQSTLDDISRRVERYPWDDLHDLGSWQAGPPAAFLRRVADRWLGGHDWRAAEAALNRVPGFLVDVDGTDVHVLEERGSGPDPATVVLVHGWPSTVHDFHRVIDPLAHPERHGGDARDGVTVVVPSMAGFGWSGRPLYPLGLRAQAGPPRGHRGPRPRPLRRAGRRLRRDGGGLPRPGPSRGGARHPRVPDAVYDLDDLLTTVMVYLVTRSFDTSLWVYSGLFGDPAELEQGQRVSPPTAYVDAGDPLVPAPLRSIPERVWLAGDDASYWIDDGAITTSADWALSSAAGTLGDW